MSEQALSGRKKFLAYSLIAFGTLSIALPVVIVGKRYRASRLQERLVSSAAPPPPRRSTLQNSTLFTTQEIKPQPSYPKLNEQVATPKTVDQDFNRPLYALKALGIASIAVFGTAALGIYSFKSYLGIRDAQEFAQRMRALVALTFPSLTSRINHSLSITSPTEHSSEWEAAEKRMSETYNEKGLKAWAEVALEEVEKEVARWEREERASGQIVSQGS